jgi:hypothetical protein
MIEKRKASGMQRKTTMKKWMATISLAILGGGMSAYADGTSWKEEVLLHDGSRIVVERSVVRKGRSEPFQRPPIGEESLSFKHPVTNVLEVEAMLPNKDIGFVNPGQEAEVKVETFPFTKYGTLQGKITQVSSDAIQDEKLGLVYATRVKLANDTIRVENKSVRLTPGMAVTVEVKTGTRRVIEYFLSPLMQYGQESLRER